MKKILIIAAASTLCVSISSVLYAGDIEKAERYTAPLNVVEMDVSANSGQKIVSKELGFGLGGNAEVQELVFVEYESMSNPEVQELGDMYGGWCWTWECWFEYCQSHVC